MISPVSSSGLWLKLTEKPASERHEAMTRVQFFNQVGLGVAALWAGSLLYGVTRGKFGYRVLSETLLFKDLPDAFDGMRIVQINRCTSVVFVKISMMCSRVLI